MASHKNDTQIHEVLHAYKLQDTNAKEKVTQTNGERHNALGFRVNIVKWLYTQSNLQI